MSADVDMGPLQWVEDHQRELGVLNLKGLTPKHNRPTVFMDTETTGFGGKDWYSSGRRQILDICAIKERPDGSLAEVYESKAQMQYLARDNAQAKALEIVGYSDEEWEGAPPLQNVMAEFVQFVSGCAVVGHNLEMDWLTFMLPSLLPYHIPRPNCFPLVCTEMLARRMMPGLPSYKLEALCERFGIEKEGHHRARGGAERCREIYKRLTRSSQATS